MNRPAVTGAGAACVGAIDLGSRNFKFVFGRKIDDRLTVEPVGKTRLEIGHEISHNHGEIGPAKLAAIDEALSGFVEYCRERNARTVLAIATSAIRNAKNRDRIEELARDLGIRLEIADGAREGRVGYLAATGGAPNRLVSDAGSKSMQVAWECAGEIRSHSVPVGYELAYESFFEHATGMDESLRGFGTFLDGNFTDLPRHTVGYTALAANSVTAFTAGLSLGQASQERLRAAAVERKIEELRALPPAGYAALKAAQPKVEKILPGLLFIAYLMGRTGHAEAHIVEAELPVGLIVEYFEARG